MDGMGVNMNVFQATVEGQVYYAPTLPLLWEIVDTHHPEKTEVTISVKKDTPDEQSSREMEEFFKSLMERRMDILPENITMAKEGVFESAFNELPWCRVNGGKNIKSEITEYPEAREYRLRVENRLKVLEDGEESHTTIILVKAKSRTRLLRSFSPDQVIPDTVFDKNNKQVVIVIGPSQDYKIYVSSYEATRYCEWRESGRLKEKSSDQRETTLEGAFAALGSSIPPQFNELIRSLSKRVEIANIAYMTLHQEIKKQGQWSEDWEETMNNPQYHKWTAKKGPMNFELCLKRDTGLEHTQKNRLCFRLSGGAFLEGKQVITLEREIVAIPLYGTPGEAAKEINRAAQTLIDRGSNYLWELMEEIGELAPLKRSKME